jgi:hypothetical protein
VTYRFVSVLNEQGFIEGRYVPITDEPTLAGVATATIASTTPTVGSTNGDGSPEKQGAGEFDVPASEVTPIKWDGFVSMLVGIPHSQQTQQESSPGLVVHQLNQWVGN